VAQAAPLARKRAGPRGGLGARARAARHAELVSASSLEPLRGLPAFHRARFFDGSTFWIFLGEGTKAQRRDVGEGFSTSRLSRKFPQPRFLALVVAVAGVVAVLERVGAGSKSGLGRGQWLSIALTHLL
jgi:hypothetical protein